MTEQKIDRADEDAAGAQEIASAHDDELKPGEVFLNQYEIISTLGKGGMSIVYCATDKLIGRKVALKLLHPHLLSDANAVQRFQREARAIGVLQHANIVRIHHFGINEQKIPYIVMDLLEGLPLSDIVESESPLSFERILNLMSQICDGLEHAHAKGVVHRDLKPSNIMVSNENGIETIKIVDFGIAKVRKPDGSDATNLTQIGDLVGSPRFMSPEQCMMMDLDHRSDLYSLGCVLYAMLTGNPPFNSENVYEIHFQHINDMPKSIKSSRPGFLMTQEFDAVILKSMAKEPSDRYQSAGEMRSALERIKQVTSSNPITKARGVIDLYLLRLKATKSGKKRLIIASVAVAYLLFTGVGLAAMYFNIVSPSEHTWNDSYLNGQHSLDRNDAEKARTSFEKALTVAEHSDKKEKLLAPSLEQMIDLSRITGKLEKVTEYQREWDEQVKGSESSTRDLDEGLSALVAKKSIKTEDEVTQAVSKVEQAIDSSTLYVKADNAPKAKKMLVDCLAIMDKLPKGHEAVYVRTLSGLAHVYHRMNDLDQAEHYYKLAADMARKNLPANDPQLGRAILGLARLSSQRKDYEKALKQLNEGLGLYRLAYGPQHENFAWVKVTLAETYIQQKKNQLAIDELKQAKHIFDEFENPAIDKKTRTYVLLGQLTNDMKLLEQALAMQEETLVKDAAYMPYLLKTLGDYANQKGGTITTHKGQTLVADGLYKRALAVSLRALPRNRELTDEIFGVVEGIAKKEGTPELMKIWYGERAREDERIFGRVSEQVADDLLRQAQYYRRLPDLYLAASSYKDGLNIENFLSKGKSWRGFQLQEGIAELAQDEGRFRDAELAYRKALITLKSDLADAKKNPLEVQQFIFRFSGLLEKLGRSGDAAALRNEWDAKKSRS